MGNKKGGRFFGNPKSNQGCRFICSLGFLVFYGFMSDRINSAAAAVPPAPAMTSCAAEGKFFDFVCFYT